MIYASSYAGQPAFNVHRTYGSFSLKFLTPVNGSSQIAAVTVGVDDRIEYLQTHGWFMWTAWGILAWLMIATKRYMKKGWLISQMLHSLIGTYITVVTLVFSFKQLAKKEWHIS